MLIVDRCSSCIVVGHIVIFLTANFQFSIASAFLWSLVVDFATKSNWTSLSRTEGVSETLRQTFHAEQIENMASRLFPFCSGELKRDNSKAGPGRLLVKKTE